ncbi:glycosyltransferase [Amphibacillus sediminis]|uniref:glycosyltransferase n=1 Tax=Amphibacillus sediminis TaxID=360185 RepID=UPI000832B11E|nr:glycosyltransferase [Amphibacillus sediminis]
MLRPFKKLVLKIIDWLVFKVLTKKQLNYLARLLNERQKELAKSLVKRGRKHKLERVNRVKYRLYELGFEQKALTELVSLYNTKNDFYLRLYAGIELALWHANKYDSKGAEEALKILDTLEVKNSEKNLIRKITIMKAECYQLLGELDKSKEILLAYLEKDAHIDIYLAIANAEKNVTRKLEYINAVMKTQSTLPVELHDHKNDALYDRLTVSSPAEKNNIREAKVTVIVPSFKAEHEIKTTLESLLHQTWQNLEIIVVDDCSPDQTYQVACEVAKTDERIKVLRTEHNSGAYVARNVGLKAATGDFITINDADDWSHIEKIEKQARFLLENPKKIGNISLQARMMDDLTFNRRGKFGMYVFPNMSSFMFRLQPVLDKVGFWDSVRFGGDSEYIRRIKKVFGQDAIVTLDTLLSFPRQSQGSLTTNSAFGYPGYFMGVRKEYFEAYNCFHNEADSLYMPFPLTKRPFPIPEPMWPVREEKDHNNRRHFDVIIASEFRLLGGTNMSNVEEIKAQKQFGLKTGLVQMYRYDLNQVKEINPNIRKMIDGEQVQFVCYGEQVTCDLLIVRHPPILKDQQKYIPNIEAEHVKVIINQTPKREYSRDGQILYDLKETEQRVIQYFKKKPTWHPIGPVIRDALIQYHQEEIVNINLSPEDWVNIIDIQEWKRDQKDDNREDDKIIIGRHSRSQYVKWPNSAEDLLRIYPADDQYKILVLGGADVPEQTLGQIPNNWEVYQFGELPPKDFLAKLDVFVYYTHPELVEAFGRVILEAMAVGVPVIISPSYKELFSDAAIYAEPEQVEDRIKELMSNPDVYRNQVEKALKYVEQAFGYTKHRLRLEPFLNDKSRDVQ